MLTSKSLLEIIIKFINIIFENSYLFKNLIDNNYNRSSIYFI